MAELVSRLVCGMAGLMVQVSRVPSSVGGAVLGRLVRGYSVSVGQLEGRRMWRGARLK